MSTEEKEKGLSTEVESSFDFSAFSEPAKVPEVKEVETPKAETPQVENNLENKVESKVESQESSSDNNEEKNTSFSYDDNSSRDDHGFVWGDNIPERNTSVSDQSETKNTEDSKETKEQEESKTEKPKETLAISEDQFSVLSKELGLEAKNAEELKKSLNDIVEENERLKENYPKTNEKIGNYEKLLNLDDKELVRQNLIADGFEGKDLDNAIERYLDNDILDIEAKKIRNTVNSAIDFEKKELIDAEANEIARQNQERENGIKDLNSYLDSTDQMFGFKISTPENVNKVRKEHQEYITSGKYLSEITTDSASLAESAWLWKNRETILKAMRNQGFNSGRADVIKEIGNPDADAGTRTFVDPKTGGEFNPGKFGARPKK